MVGQAMIVQMLHVILDQFGQIHLAIETNTFRKYIQKSWVGEKGKVLYNVACHRWPLQAQQATSHPKAMRQPHPTILSKSTIFFHTLASSRDFCRNLGTIIDIPKTTVDS